MDLAGLFSPQAMAQAKKNEDEQKLLEQQASSPPPVATQPIAGMDVAPLASPQPQPSPEVPVVPLTQIAPQVVSTVDTTTTTGTAGQKATKAEADLIKNQEKIFADQQAQAEKAAEAGRQKAIADAAQADEKAKITADKQTKTDAILQDGEKILSERLAESERVYQAMKEKADIKDYWADKSTGDKVLAGLGIALGGLGAGMAGHSSNRALDVINKAIEQDFARQRANFENAKDMATESRNRVQDTRQNTVDKVNMLNLSKAAAYDTLGDKYASLAAKRGVSEADLAKDALLLDLRAKQNQARMEYEKGLRQNVSSQVQTKVDQTVLTPVDVASKQSEGIKKVQDEIQGNKDFEAWKKKRQGLDSFSEMKKAGATGAALVDFVAGGLQQGSFGPEMVALLEKRSLIGKGGEILRENIQGGFDQNLMNALENGLKAQEAKSRRQARGVIARAEEQAQRLGLPKDYFVGSDEQKAQKTLVKKQFNAGLNKTKLIYSDGSEEIVDGQQ